MKNIANLQKNFLLSDYLLYPSEYMKDCMFRDYMLEPIFKNKVLMSGYPRNEIFFAKERYEAVRQENGITDKVCIAYMPIWRGNARAVKETQKQDVLAYLSEMDKQLTEQQILFVNLYPFIANALEYSRFKHIRPFPEKYETYEFLNACDMLITDYSSVMFDYAVTGRKIILFTYDENEYFTNRGVHVTLSELPFAKVSTVKQLIEEINNTENVDCFEFLKKFALYESQDISKRICTKVILQRDAGVLSYYYTYDTADLRGNEQHMKLLPKELLYFGKLNSCSAVSLKDSIVLYMSKTSSRWNDFFVKC